MLHAPRRPGSAPPPACPGAPTPRAVNPRARKAARRRRAGNRCRARFTGRRRPRMRTTVRPRTRRSTGSPSRWPPFTRTARKGSRAARTASSSEASARPTSASSSGQFGVASAAPARNGWTRRPGTAASRSERPEEAASTGSTTSGTRRAGGRRRAGQRGGVGAAPQHAGLHRARKLPGPSRSASTWARSILGVAGSNWRCCHFVQLRIVRAGLQRFLGARRRRPASISCAPGACSSGRATTATSNCCCARVASPSGRRMTSPMRNYVERGSSAATPRCPRCRWAAAGRWPVGDVLLLCSDGLWSAA